MKGRREGNPPRERVAGAALGAGDGGHDRDVVGELRKLVGEVPGDPRSYIEIQCKGQWESGVVTVKSVERESGTVGGLFLVKAQKDYGRCCGCAWRYGWLLGCHLQSRMV